MSDPTDLPQLDPFAEGLPDMAELIAMANADSDAVSIFILGEDFKECAGALVVVRGGSSARHLYKLLVGSGLLTRDKMVMVDSKHAPEVTAPALYERAPDGALIEYENHPGNQATS
jgi:hypothetical protein